MNYKNKILPMFDKINQIAIKHSVSNNIIESITEQKNESEKFKVFIPLLGTFNAGKSSLLNSLLKKEVLPTNIVPETSIAAELRYGKENHIIAFKKNGEKQDVYPITDIQSITPKQYTHIEIYQDGEILKELDNIVIVDMPGLDSAISEHNQAIINYIKQGVYYIILAEVEFGLKESVLNFLYELNAYDIDFSILISKTDHKLPEDVEKVQQNVKTVTKNITGKDITVGKVSTKLNDISDFEDILKNIDQTNLMIKNLEPKIMSSINQVQKDLEIRLKHYSIDTVEIDQKIKELEKGLININDEIGIQEQEITNKFGNETVENILNEVKEVLNESMFTLVKAAKSGGDHLNREINNLIRPTLINAVDFYVTEVFSHSFKNISGKLDKLTDNLSIVNTELQEVNKKVTNVLDVVSNPKFRTVIGGIALATSVVAPWIELIIFFLPEIIKIFSNQDKQIEAQIEEQVIPEIIVKLRPEIKQNLNLVKDQFIEEMQKQVENEKMSIISSLRQAKEDKQTIQQEGQMIIIDIQTSIETLQKMRENLIRERSNIEFMG